MLRPLNRYVVLPVLQHKTFDHKPLSRAALTFTSYTFTRLVLLLMLPSALIFQQCKGRQQEEKGS